MSKNVLFVVANQIEHPRLGFPIGFWAAELSHPYAELTNHGYEVTIASPNGGAVYPDAYSDPRDASQYSVKDFVSLGFLESPMTSPLLKDTKALKDVKVEDYAAIIVAGGQSPMFTFRENEELKALILQFYEASKPTAALCHGVASLVDIKTADGQYLIAGKTITGFSAAEDAFADEALGVKLFDWWIEPTANDRGANYVQNGMWANYAIADGNLITGQQQNSGVSVARLVIEQLEA